ncbi:hypothetical protein [Geoalkalibacter halelectricus]|uniref:Phospholipase D-like domain-containing protein n=1 Tax=Geoalkalibacter halelectricus TaxID=2847045 RepID=A0ABY5ZH67_9BACT|nr:hypothetical protein [Geoalkalibacter halelectricus]MDO3376540.1 hypothetical protein [Geoalkalibacter halelectricus]UWZ78493.1 hypothetical protein L9S41_12485 [Geoalkalibacter halelectricus]
MTANIEQISLLDFFKFKAPTHLLGTTYTVSLMFFESAVWPSVDKTRLKRCLVLCDKEGFRRAAYEASGLKEVSLSYMAIPVPTERTFHPKFWIAVNNKEVSFLVGSGNLTQSGFVENNELFDVVFFDHSSADPSLTTDLINFLKGLRGLFSTGNENGQWVIETIHQIVDLLPLGLPENAGMQAARLLHSFSSTFPEELANLSPGEGADLYLASPYFGTGLDGLELLRDEVKPKRVIVCPARLNKGINFQSKYVADDDAVEICKLKIGKEGALSHFKLYGLAHPSGNGLLFNGSVNCTYLAMISSNIEAGLARQVTSKEVEEYFRDREPHNDLNFESLTSSQSTDEMWIVIYAINLGGALELTIPATKGIELPLDDVVVTLRRENDIALAKFGRLFSTQAEKPRLAWDNFWPLPQNLWVGAGKK